MELPFSLETLKRIKEYIKVTDDAWKVMRFSKCLLNFGNWEVVADKTIFRMLEREHVFDLVAVVGCLPSEINLGGERFWRMQYYVAYSLEYRNSVYADA